MGQRPQVDLRDVAGPGWQGKSHRSAGVMRSTLYGFYQGLCEVSAEQELTEILIDNMKITIRNVMCRGAVGLIALTIGFAGCKTSGDRTATQKMSDNALSRSVKKGLADDPDFKYPDIHANVYEGTIQLSGFVNNEEQRLRAAEIASRVKGARQVINNVMIKPTPTGPVTIRDPLGRESGRLLVDTNSPPQILRNLPSSETAPQPSERGAGGTSPNQ
jgi:hypothetical protein